MSRTTNEKTECIGIFTKLFLICKLSYDSGETLKPLSQHVYEKMGSIIETLLEWDNISIKEYSMDNVVEVVASVIVVPYHGAEYYFENEILSEGKHHRNVPFIPLLNYQYELENIKYEEMALNFMSMLRRDQDSQLTLLGDIKIDIGLVDIQVIFKGNTQIILNTIKQDSQSLLRENAIKIDEMTQGMIHDQMLMGSSLHTYHPSGEISVHYHNVIFGVRVENKRYTYLDLSQMLRAISEEGYTVSLVAAKTHLV